jgi:hypothetical protein
MIFSSRTKTFDDILSGYDEIKKNIYKSDMSDDEKVRAELVLVITQKVFEIGAKSIFIILEDENNTYSQFAGTKQSLVKKISEFILETIGDEERIAIFANIARFLESKTKK